MNRTQLIDRVAARTEGTKAEAAKYLNAILGTIADNLTEGDGELVLPDFGRFSVKKVAERQGFNPQTKEKIEIKSANVPAFKASKTLKDLVK